MWEFIIQTKLIQGEKDDDDDNDKEELVHKHSWQKQNSNHLEDEVA